MPIGPFVHRLGHDTYNIERIVRLYQGPLMVEQPIVNNIDDDTYLKWTTPEGVIVDVKFNGTYVLSGNVLNSAAFSDAIDQAEAVLQSSQQGMSLDDL
jgi:hypothetical protein